MGNVMSVAPWWVWAAFAVLVLYIVWPAFKRKGE